MPGAGVYRGDGMKPTSIRLSETERLAIRAAADKVGKRVSPFIRETMIQRCNVVSDRDASVPEVPAVLTVDQEEILKGLHNNLRALRGLVNQIARALNTMNKGFAVENPPEDDDISTTLSSLDDAADAVKAALRDGGSK